MPVIEVQAEISAEYLAIIDKLRGVVPLGDFLRDALKIGLCHMQEEILQQQRIKTYERLAFITNQYSAAFTAQDVAEPGKGKQERNAA